MLKLRSATAIIAIVTVAVSAVAILWNVNLAATYWGFAPAQVGVPPAHELAIPWWLTPFTSALLHGNWLHLIFNMAVLLFVGSQVERVIGGSAVLFAYIVGGLGACAAQYAVEPMGIIPLIGAGGAISALVGLYALFFGRPKPIASNMRLNRWIHVLWLLATWAVLQLMVGILAGPANLAQLVAGAAVGFVAGVLLQKPLLLWRYRGA